MSDELARLRTALSARYVIERQIGRGGMATVYLANDLRHERAVALKVLRDDLAAVMGAERFLHEIKVTAKLQHPHILTLIDSGGADGLLYYVMPYVDGESLRQRLQRDERLPLHEVLAIAHDVASALDFAHSQGVIHRDVKPENILLHHGEPMVADFGIALAVSSAGGERLTETGWSLGTPAYMSPEQLAGDPDLNQRSDVYSLACVVYEMLTRDRPYEGPTVAAIITKQLFEQVPSVTDRRQDTPAHVDAVLRRALAKNPEDRFGSATAFADALSKDQRSGLTPIELFSTARSSPPDKSIVVLPFANLSPDPEDAYFSDGLTEELITDLSRIGDLRVVSSASAFRLKGTDKDVRTIGRELRVCYILEGRVRKAGRSVRITAQLVDVRYDSPVWADKYSGSLDNVFELQEKVSVAIADALHVRLNPSARAPKAEGAAAYLKGRHGHSEKPCA